MLLKEEIDRNSLVAIDASIDENIQLRQQFDLCEDSKRLNSFKMLRRNI